MSPKPPEGPYIYQPFGSQDREHWEADRIYAIGGLSHLTTIKGLTRAEAEAILKILETSAPKAKAQPPRDPSWRDEPTGYVPSGPTLTTNVTPPVAERINIYEGAKGVLGPCFTQEGEWLHKPGDPSCGLCSPAPPPEDRGEQEATEATDAFDLANPLTPEQVAASLLTSISAERNALNNAFDSQAALAAQLQTQLAAAKAELAQFKKAVISVSSWEDVVRIRTALGAE